MFTEVANSRPDSKARMAPLSKIFRPWDTESSQTCAENSEQLFCDPSNHESTHNVNSSNSTELRNDFSSSDYKSDSCTNKKKTESVNTTKNKDSEKEHFKLSKIGAIANQEDRSGEHRSSNSRSRYFNRSAEDDDSDHNEILADVGRTDRHPEAKFATWKNSCVTTSVDGSSSSSPLWSYPGCGDHSSPALFLHPNDLSSLSRNELTALGLLTPEPSVVKVKRQRPKRFHCPHCQVAFSNNGQLRGHIRIHTGERPFSCDHEGCGKSFTRNEELTRHRRIHSGLRPFGCTYCGKKFGRKDHLKKHTRTHTRPLCVPMIGYPGGILPGYPPSFSLPFSFPTAPHLPF